MRARDSKRLVIDADVAQASGDEGATHPRAINCRDFLKGVMLANHKIVMSREIRDEWKEHHSGFARRWLVSMDARRKVVRVTPSQDNTLRDKVTNTTSDAAEIEAMEKDFHLIQAALATDRCVVSLDETIRSHFKRAAQSVSDIREVVWVNPNRAEEQPLLWLQNGAPSETDRQLFDMGL